MRVAMFSSGAGSAVAAKLDKERHPDEEQVLLFADVNGEHPDNYRFLHEAAAWVGSPLVVLDNGGRTIWDVFREARFLGNTRADVCSRMLKREPMRAWLDENCDPCRAAWSQYQRELYQRRRKTAEVVAIIDRVTEETRRG